MNTIIEKIDINNIDLYQDVFEKASKIINNNGLVAFPTETVYGLGANAFSALALKKIFEAKGRPSDNPLIAHIGELSDLEALIIDKNETAKLLIKEFWPGPLTLVFNKSKNVPKELTGGLNTVAIRFPENIIARELIKKSKVPIAAPSANSSGKPSPTRASHVEYDLFGKIDMIIDGGNSEYGLESTIVDVSTDKPFILRPGSITYEMIRDVLGDIEIDKTVFNKPDKDLIPKAPGMKYKHYSPRAKVTIVNGNLIEVTQKINELAYKNLTVSGKTQKIGILATEQTKDKYDNKEFLVLVVGDRDKEETIASNLFKMLRKFDYYKIDFVFAEGFEDSKLSLAIMNRLRKAAGYSMIYV